jgi:hypothetical protein
MAASPAARYVTCWSRTRLSSSPAVDYCTLRHLADSLGRMFWRDLEIHYPGIDSLAPSAEVERLETAQPVKPACTRDPTGYVEFHVTGSAGRVEKGHANCGYLAARPSRPLVRKAWLSAQHSDEDRLTYWDSSHGGHSSYHGHQLDAHTNASSAASRPSQGRDEVRVNLPISRASLYVPGQRAKSGAGRAVVTGVW